MPSQTRTGVLLLVGGALGLAGALSLTGCAAGRAGVGDGPHRLRVVDAAGDEERRELLGRVQALAGEWEMAEPGPEGTPPPGTVTNVFARSSAGSAVREVMFPGTPHEMTNVYHMDGPDLMMTHYCAAGNQPRMRAVRAQSAVGPDGAERIRFAFDGVSNLTAPDEMYMGEMTLVILGPNRIRQEWRTFRNGRAIEGPTVFDLKRKGT